MDGYTTISAVAKSSGAELLRDLETLGLVSGAADSRMVTGRLPSANVERAASLPSLQYVRPEWMIPSTGAVHSQGDKALRADVGRGEFGVTGKGVTVGVLSDSFDCLGSYNDDVASGDLPAGVSVMKEGDCADGTDEGRAMAQIIADIAPEATIKFRTAAGGELAMRNGITDLVRAGADVIVDDITYIGEPWFQDGLVAQAVDAAEAAGVSYFSSAGNSGDTSYERPFDDSGVEGLAPGSRIHDFDPGPGVDYLQRVTIGPMNVARIELQWLDNFKTHVPSGPAPKTDLNFIALTEDGTAFYSAMPNIESLQPFEHLIVPNLTESPVTIDLAIERVEGPSPALMKWIGLRGKLRVDQFATSSNSTLIGHHQASGAMAVGAAGFKKTPAFGTSPPELRSYSSRGGSPLLLGRDGLPLKKPFERQKPELVAADGVNTTFFGEDSPDDGDKLQNFDGTSAAAPHAAGVAALLLESVPTARPTDVCNAMATTAVEMDAKGFDFQSGHGLVDARAALGWLTAKEKEGPCGAAPIEVALPTPPPAEPDPKPITAPTSSAPPAGPPATRPSPEPIAISAPIATPAPTPIPNYPHLFVDETDVFVGGTIKVSGWYLPRNTQFDLTLDGERPLGSARSNTQGRLAATSRVPEGVPEGRYIVTGTSGGERFVAVRAVTVRSVALVNSVAEQAPPPAVSSGLGFGAVLVLAIFAVFAGFVLFLAWTDRRATSGPSTPPR